MKIHGQDSRATSLLVRLVDFGLAASVLLPALVLGGRHPLGQILLVALAVATAVSWCLSQHFSRHAAWQSSPANWLLAAATLLVGFQLVELPPSILESLSGRTFQTLPLWAPHGDTATLGVWKTVSLAPAATRRSLVLLGAVALLIAVTLQRVRRIDDVERLVRWIAYSTVAVAAFGLVQYFTSNGKFYWFYQDTFATTRAAVNGCFTNPNHFAEYLALGVGPLVWLLLEALKGRGVFRGTGFQVREAHGQDGRATPGAFDPKTLLVAFGLAVVLFAGLMSRSRGGALAILTAAGVCLAVLWRGGLVGRKTLSAGVGVGVFVVAGLWVYGYQPVADELADFRSLATLDQNAVRRRLWTADFQAFTDFALVGTGAGSHRDINAAYFHDPATDRFEYTHAENSYLQILMETGIPGGTLVLAAAGLLAFCCIGTLRRPLPSREMLSMAAIVPGIAASFVHAAADYIWYVPGCVVPLGILAACAVRMWQSAPGPYRAESNRTVWLTAAACVALVGGMAIRDRLAVVRAEPSWHAFTLLEQATPHGSLSKQGSAETLQAMADALTETLRWQPDHGRAHARLAEVHLARFEQADADVLGQGGVKGIRDAALASNFDSPAALRAWLDRAFPEHWRHLELAWRHAHLAARHAPFEPEGYLFLANVCFFDGPRSPATGAYVAQAQRVRPFDGNVLFEAGREALFGGDMAGAFAHWQEAYQSGESTRKQLEAFLAAIMPAATFLEMFEPDLAGLARLDKRYADLRDPDESRVMRTRYVAALEDHARSLDGPAAADAWQSAANLHRQLGEPDQRLRCLECAVACQPDRYETRHLLGKCFLDRQDYPQAEENLRWCLQWKPHDKALRQDVDAAMDGRLRMSNRPPDVTR